MVSVLTHSDIGICGFVFFCSCPSHFMIVLALECIPHINTVVT